MSTGSLGTIGSITTGQLQQSRQADAERANQDTTSQSRRADTTLRAENAAGIGQTEQESATSDRDADGRRLWERSGKRPGSAAASESAEAEDTARSRDPAGHAGTQLDLSG